MGIFDKSRKTQKIAKEIRNQVEALRNPREVSAGLVKVTLHYNLDGGEYSGSDHIVAEGDVLTFLTASLELHHQPGMNPHNENPASPVQVITAAVMRPKGPFWWSTPGLEDNYLEDGAVIFDWDPLPRIIWSHPDMW